MKRSLAIALFAAFPFAAGADVSLDRLRDLKGYTIISVPTVRGEFKGCDFDRRIAFDDGTVLTCSSYGYQYAYNPTAVLFGKTFDHNGGTFIMVKMLVEGQMYDMLPTKIR